MKASRGDWLLSQPQEVHHELSVAGGKAPKPRKKDPTLEWTPKERRVFDKWLTGEYNARQASAKLGISKQQIINLTSTVFRVWYQKGKVTIEEDV